MVGGATFSRFFPNSRCMARAFTVKLCEETTVGGALLHTGEQQYKAATLQAALSSRLHAPSDKLFYMRECI